MAFQNYNIADNSYWELEFDIDSTQTTIHLSEQQNMPTSNFVATIESYDSQGNVDNREKILVSDRTDLTLTVDTRGFDGTTASSFLAGDQVSLLVETAVIDDIKNEVVRLETDKADKNNVLELDNTTSYTPTSPYHPATKQYVDNNTWWAAVNISNNGTQIVSEATDINFNENVIASDDWDGTVTVDVDTIFIDWWSASTTYTTNQTIDGGTA